MTGFVSDHIVVPGLQQISSLAYGRGLTQFRQLITYMAIVSLALWAFVGLTMILRLLLLTYWRHRYRVTVKINVQT